MVAQTSARIRAVLVDDEPPARARLRQMLEQSPNVEVVGEAANGDEALEQIHRARPDLVFLDIQMPGRDGIHVAAELAPPRPQIIFCTAFDRYAVEAFDQHAVDYLMKPVSRTRLEQALDRVRETLQRQRLYSDELQHASATQARLFPQRLPALRSLDYSGICRPAGGVGGDYYDFLEVAPQRLGIALGDVSGKGMPAALLMANLQGQLHSRAFQRLDLPTLMQQLNQSVFELTDDNRFITLFYGVYDDTDHTLRYCNAGHNPPFRIRITADGTISHERLGIGGPLLGVLPDAVYSEHQVALKNGDLCIFFTDGVVEAANQEDEEFGEERLMELVLRHHDLSATDLRDRLLEAVSGFSQGQQEDDITLIVLRVKALLEKDRESADRR